MEKRRKGHICRKADSTVNREFLNSRSTPPTRASTHVVGLGTHVISFPIPQPNKYPSRPPLSLPFASSILSLSLSARQAPRPQGARAEARRRQGSSPRDLAQGGGGELCPSGSAHGGVAGFSGGATAGSASSGGGAVGGERRGGGLRERRRRSGRRGAARWRAPRAAAAERTEGSTAAAGTSASLRRPRIRGGSGSRAPDPCPPAPGRRRGGKEAPPPAAAPDPDFFFAKIFQHFF